MFILLNVVDSDAQTYLVKDSNTNVTSRDYKASLFGIKSNGITLNTNSIQKAIDFINAKGGGRLVFYVGRYLTGSIQLKSNVIIHLEEGAVLVSSESIYDYRFSETGGALITVENVNNSGITGKGVIEGNGIKLQKVIKHQIAKGFINSATPIVPALINVDSSNNLLFSLQNYIDVAADAIQLRNSSKIIIDSASIKSIISTGNSSGIIKIFNCEGVIISKCFLDTSAPYIKVGKDGSNIKVKNVMVSDGMELNFVNGNFVYSKKLIKF